MEKRTQWALAVLIGYMVLVQGIDAYTMSRVKTVRNVTYTQTVTVIPKNLTLDSRTINALMQCRPQGGAVAYQAGYADSCDWVLNLLGLKYTRFASHPSANFQPLGYQDSTISYTFKVRPEGYIFLNSSTYKLEVRSWDGNVRRVNLTVGDEVRLWPK
jgi:hypothetical protein